MVNMCKKFEERHKKYYSSTRPNQNKGRISAPGMQYLVHLLKGGYLGKELRDGTGKRALDVGCGSGFNSVTMAMMGWEVDACEINKEVVRHAKTNIQLYGYDIRIRIGENENLPYSADTFDFLLSMNVIHYVQSREAVRKTIQEYARVLKKGGRVLLSTNHPKNWLLERHQKLNGDMIRINCSGDYRNGQKLFLFSSTDMLYSYFSDHFVNIMVGENRFDFFTKTIRNWVLTGTKA